MSIQFRSRVKGQRFPIINIVGQTTNGFCCGPNVVTTRVQCVDKNGYFLPGETTSINCPTNDTCAQIPLIAEIPGACCYWEKVNNEYFQKCKTTNSIQECANSNQGAAENLSYSFYAGETCVIEGGNISCNRVKATIEDISNNCNPNDTTNCFDIKNIYGNCCTINSDIEDQIDCSITTENECISGIWTPPGLSGVLSCSGFSPCQGLYYSSSAKTEPIKVLETKITDSKNPFEKLPQIGEQYQGGIYLGIFKPGSPINSIGSMVYGSAVGYKESSDYEARATGPGTQEKSWILIASNQDYGEFGYNLPNEASTIVNSSVYDGYYNSYELEQPYKNLLMDAVRNYTDSYGFNDWYIPSQDELAFYFKNIAYNYSTSKFNKLVYSEYMSSTTFVSGGKQKFNNVSFIYTQKNNELDYGKILIKEKHEKIGVRLFRRIYLSN